jgi:hypothetical protein
VLRATFVRTAGERDRVYVTRSDGTEVSWSFPTYGDGLPHDLVHWVVEACCGLRSGFWARVDGGADPGAINARANREGGRQKYTAFGSEQDELYVAEALAAAGWWRESATEEELRESVRVQCDRWGASPFDLSAEQTRQVRRTLESLERQWRALRPKGFLKVVFRSDRPEESVHESGTDGGADPPDAEDRRSPSTLRRKKGRR